MKGLNYKFKSGLFKGKTVKQVVSINPNHILALHDAIKVNLSFNREVLQACYKSQFQLK